MRKYFSKISILILVCLVLFAFGCGGKKNVKVNDETPGDKTKVAQTDSGTEDTKMDDGSKDDDSMASERLEQQRKEEEKKKKAQARAKFENENIYFEFDSSDLTTSAQSILEEKAQWLKENPYSQITIEGHCDDRGTTEYNLALGDRRAQSAKKYLVALGIEDTRIDTLSYGEEKPALNGSGDAVWSKNRRDAFVINK